MGDDCGTLRRLIQHQTHAITVENNEMRGIAPKPAVSKPKRIAIVICCDDHITYKQHWRRRD
jgi:hypothetical protein